MHKDPKIEEHLARLYSALFNTYDLKDVVRYLTEKTYLRGDRFSFKNHEFQETILSDISPVLNVQKCAQVGMSEAMARYALGVTRIMPYFSTIMTMPFSGDASNFAKTRLDPIIQDSPDLRESLDPDLNNSEIKGIGTGLLYMRGTSGTTAALSVPADMLIHDEIDRSDPDTLAQYQSRIKHSDWKLTRKFGTPTINGFGIALEMETSRRMRHMCKCQHCNHNFLPSYHTDVHIPGFNGDKQEITKYNLNSYRWQEAVLQCPRCGQEPSLQMEHREWVLENPGGNFEAIGYYVTPFSVPNIPSVSIASLVKESTKYTTHAEFCNQALGETASDNNEQLTSADLENCKYTSTLDSSDMHHGGVDMGLICHFVIGRMLPDGKLLVVYRERCLLDKVEQRKRELAVKYRVLMWVFDAFPYTDTILRMQRTDKNLLGAVYHGNKKLATYEIVQADPKVKEGKLPINVAKIHRNLNFDQLMGLFKRKCVIWRALGTDDDQLFVNHCTDMKRKQALDQVNELVYVWAKSSEGNDHYMHALGYLHVACRLAPAVSRQIPFQNVPLLSTFKVKHA